MSLRHLVTPLAVGLLIAATAAPARAAGTAEAARGEIVVFATELQRAKVFTNPSGCKRLPVGAHVVVNLTDRQAKLYADPFCRVRAVPFVVVKPGYGSHVSTVGSFNTDS